MCAIDYPDTNLLYFEFGSKRLKIVEIYNILMCLTMQFVFPLLL